MVDIGGHKLNVRQGGAARPGVPTVIFENGLGTPLQSWQRVQEEISSVARTISYDRSGIGKSDAGKEVPTPANIARQLHTLLDKLGASPPYVLVGHSYGGPLSHAFATTYPKEVAGLVYVDPTDFTQTLADIQDVWNKGGAPDGRAWMEKLYEQSLQSAPAGVQAEVREVMKVEQEGFAVFRAMGTAPDVPIVVLLAGKNPSLPATFPGDVDKFSHALISQRLEHFGNMTRRAKNGLLLLVGTSGHFIQSTEPNTVVVAIRRVLDAASAPSALK